MTGSVDEPTPDYTQAAEATAAGNLQNTQYQTIANRPDQTTPWGSTSWSQSVGPESEDEYNQAMQQWQASGEQGVEPTLDQFSQWNENETLTPQEQSAVTDQQNIQAGQGQIGENLENQVASTMDQPFEGPNYEQMMSTVPGVNSGYSGFNYQGPGVNTTAINSPTLATNSEAYTGAAGATPTFNQSTANAGATAAFNAEDAMLQPQMQEATQTQEAQLAAQGLQPGTVAYDNAMRDLSNSQSTQLDSLANSAVQTGDQEATQNYQNELAGQSQGYGEGLSSFNANNSAQEQQLEAEETAQQAQNAAQNQDYTQAEGTYQTGQQALEDQNQAQQQDYTEALQNYGQEYTAAQNQYLEPLNAMNASLNGYEVGAPSMPGFTNAGTTAGTNYSQATGQMAQWESGQEAENQAANSALEGDLGSLAGAGLMALAL